ncbi:uncharacterized protein LOC112187228 isoform X1 [Rosa chinensis]|uniref:uncharacterized protein LOC112187228 isoform X1 n=1 Tax=Rosa chinensis TaxID=74649 RepID=UPI001AD8D349|nr:uncharacterized protein LOC112187228 isoform X1 [Rosa chinensis]
MTSALDFSPSISESLGDVTIFTAAGDAVQFKDLWDQNEGVVVVALLRHFGCPGSWELAATLKESKAKFDSAGVKLIAVGVGSPDKACVLAERLPFPFMLILIVRRIISWVYTMDGVQHSSIQPLFMTGKDVVKIWCSAESCKKLYD